MVLLASRWIEAGEDTGIAVAKTAYGTCGVKVWVFRGEILEHDPMAQDKRMSEANEQGGRGGQRAPAAA